MAAPRVAEYVANIFADEKTKVSRVFIQRLLQQNYNNRANKHNKQKCYKQKEQAKVQQNCNKTAVKLCSNEFEGTNHLNPLLSKSVVDNI